jgi:transcriptional regulator with XRE-family HTH domain
MVFVTTGSDEATTPGDLAAAVRACRAAAGLSQVELARQAGITPSYVSRIESAAWRRGGPWPSDDVLRALARVLGCSSTRLIELRRTEREAAGGDTSPRAWRPRNGGTRYAVSMGHDDVDIAAHRLVERNPPRGSVRLTMRLGGQGQPGPLEARYAEALARRMVEDTSSILYCVCVVGPGNADRVRAVAERLAGGRDPLTVDNVRTRCCFSPPATLDVIVAEREALIAVPDRRGHPFLRAALLIEDPDFVAALRDWFDDYVWEPAGGYVDLRALLPAGPG